MNNDAKPREPKVTLQLALPSRFHPLNDDKRLLELIRQLELKEAQECEKIYQDILSEDAVLRQVNIPLDGIM